MSLFTDTQIKLDRALSERTLLQTRLLKFRTTADLLHDEKSQTRKDQRAAPWERFGAFELKLQDLEIKLSTWEEKIVDVEDRLVRLDEYCEELFALEGTPTTYMRTIFISTISTYPAALFTFTPFYEINRFCRK